VVYDAHTLLETELNHYFPGPLGGIASRVGTWLDVTLPRGVAHAVAISGAIRDRLVESGAMPPERVTVIGNGVEQEHFEVAVRDHRPGGAERIIFTGNLAPYQGIDLMLTAFRQIQARRKGVRLSIVTASSFEPYEALAAELGVRDAIDLAPASFDRLPHDLADSAVALNPRTRCDGIPLKLLNYMSAARPIVSFEGSAHGLEHEKTALVVPDGDTQAFAGAVVQLLEQPVMAARLGANARRTSRERHSWGSTAHRVETVYERVLG
jgi:glycosyltransferase involved in cell wall biosynthesis